MFFYDMASKSSSTWLSYNETMGGHQLAEILIFHDITIVPD